MSDVFASYIVRTCFLRTFYQVKCTQKTRTQNVSTNNYLNFKIYRSFGFLAGSLERKPKVNKETKNVTTV